MEIVSHDDRDLVTFADRAVCCCTCGVDLMVMVIDLSPSLIRTAMSFRCKCHFEH